MIDLNYGEIPNSIIMNFDGKQIRQLTKTVIRIKNSGKKTINKSDLEPSYITIPFEKNNPDLVHFIKIDMHTSNSYAKTSLLEDDEKLNICFDFNFLDFHDFIKIEILHTAKNPPTEIRGYIKGSPNSFVNLSEKQNKITQNLKDVFISDLSNTLLNFLIKNLIK